MQTSRSIIPTLTEGTMKKTTQLYTAALFLCLTSACSSTKKLYPVSDEPLSKDRYEWEQGVVNGACKFRARDAEMIGITKSQTWVRVEYDNDGKSAVTVDPGKIILRSPLLKDSIQPIPVEKLLTSLKARIEGTEKMISESTWEGVKEIDAELGKDSDAKEVREASASHDTRIRERANASDEMKRLESLIPIIETQVLKSSSLEAGGRLSGILVYDTDFTRKGSATLDSTLDTCKVSLQFKVKP